MLATFRGEKSRLKQDVPIVDLARRLGLEVRGRQARCYNSHAHKHNDRHFSMGLDERRNRYKCFACGEQGDVIDLYMRVRGVGFGEAVKELANWYGLAFRGFVNVSKLGEHKKQSDEAFGGARGGDLCKVYEEFYSVCGGLDKESKEYLVGRGLKQEAIERFLLFSVSDYKKVDRHLKDRFSVEELRLAGLVSYGGNLIFYKHKIIIPFLQDGRIVFLQGRRLDQGQPKYLHIRRPVPLYNQDALVEAEEGQKVYIAEGVFDVMMLEQNGYSAVGILGVNNFKQDYISLFKKFEVVLALDNDEAGKKATKRLAKMFYEQGQRVNSIQLPNGVKDVSDYFNLGGKE